jgi:hypothetical protein
MVCPNAASSADGAASSTRLPAASPLPTAAAANIIARNNNPLPTNTVEKNLSSSVPNPSRTTPMNQRNVIPANGISMVASRIMSARPLAHCDPCTAPSGSASRMSTSTAPKISPNSTPATAAARGVVRRRS